MPSCCTCGTSHVHKQQRNGGEAHVFSLGQCGVCAMFGFNCSPIYLPTPLRTRFPVSRVQITLSHTLIIKWNYMFRKLKLDELKYVYFKQGLKLQLNIKKVERNLHIFIDLFKIFSIKLDEIFLFFLIGTQSIQRSIWKINFSYFYCKL